MEDIYLKPGVSFRTEDKDVFGESLGMFILEHLTNKGILSTTDCCNYATEENQRLSISGLNLSITKSDGVTILNTVVLPSGGYSDEMAQDAVGNILVSSATVTPVYNDGSNYILANVNISNTPGNAISVFSVVTPPDPIEGLYVGAENGLYVNGSSNNISLGGALLEDTTITATGFEFAVNDTDLFTINSIGRLYLISQTNAVHIQGVGISNVSAGNIELDSATGAYYIKTLPAQTSETEVIYVNSSTGKLSKGVPGSSNITLAENTSIVLDPTLSADGKYSGVTETGVAGETLVFGNLVYFKAADSRWWLTDADAEATSGPVRMGFVVLAASAATTTTILLFGKIRADSLFPTLTIGAPVYASTTAGNVQTTKPSGPSDVIRSVGYAITTDEMFISISNEYTVVP